jgi:FHA domain
MHGVEFNDRLLSLAVDGFAVGAAETPAAIRGATLRESLPAQVDQLREHWTATPTEPVWVTVSPLFDTNDLGELLRLLRGQEFHVQGFADGACASVAWLPLEGQVLVLDLGARGLAISHVARAGSVVELHRKVHLAQGQIALLDLWLRLVAATLVDQTRFDALHDPQHEAQLRSGLLQLIPAVQRDGSGTVTLDIADRDLNVSLTRDQLVDAAREWFQPLSAALQALCAGLGDCTVLIPESLLAFPGMQEALGTAHAGVLLAVPDGLSARSVSLMPFAAADQSGAVPYLTRVTGIEPAAPRDACRAVQLDAPGTQVMATHLVFRGRAIEIPSGGLVLGRDPPVEAGALRLPEGTAGLSRCHCTLKRGAQGTQIIDHSQFGTFVDGARINGRGYLLAGSTLRLGSPGIELPLVSLQASATS